MTDVAELKLATLAKPWCSLTRRPTSVLAKVLALAVIVTVPVLPLAVRVVLSGCVLERATLEIDSGDRPGCVAGARDLSGRMVGVDDIHHVRRLRELDVGELGVEVGRRHLDRAATRYNRAAILVDSKMLVAELQDIGLLDIKLEGDQPDVVCAVLDLADEDRARPPACAAMRVDDKFSSVLQPLKLWMSVRPSGRGSAHQL